MYEHEHTVHPDLNPDCDFCFIFDFRRQMARSAQSTHFQAQLSSDNQCCSPYVSTSMPAMLGCTGRGIGKSLVADYRLSFARLGVAVCIPQMRTFSAGTWSTSRIRVSPRHQQCCILQIPLFSVQSLSLFHASQKRCISIRSNSAEERRESRRLIHIALIGNLTITIAKASIWAITGSSALMSETIHSLVGFANQALLLLGHHRAQSAADKLHQYGYGKDIYFWSLISALGTFWFGAGIAGWNSIISMMEPSIIIHSMGYEMWCVLGFSFLVDGYVLLQTVKSLHRSKPKNISFIQHVQCLRDPTTLAVLMEDSAACVGIGIAVTSVGLTQITHLPICDAIGGLAVSCIMGSMGLYLASLNHRFLLGQAVDPEITQEIKNILVKRSSVEDVHGVQSQWIGPYVFSYKAEVDFDGTFLAAKLMQRYQDEFMGGRKLDVDEVKVLLAFYAEDVMRTVEQEVKEIEADIKAAYPAAKYIELEPHSSKARSYAIDDGKEASSKRTEIDRINLIQKEMLMTKPEQ